MTTAELAEMVRVMRRDQLNWHQHMTSAAAMKANYSERVVDKAVAAILADEPGQDREFIEALTVDAT